MIFITTLIGFVIAMLLMALGVLSGKPNLRKRCGDECTCVARERSERPGRTI
jgi:hypothetical protein